MRVTSIIVHHSASRYFPGEDEYYSLEGFDYRAMLAANFEPPEDTNTSVSVLFDTGLHMEWLDFEMSKAQGIGIQDMLADFCLSDVETTTRLGLDHIDWTGRLH